MQTPLRPPEHTELALGSLACTLQPSATRAHPACWPCLVLLSPSGLALQWLFAGQEVCPPAGSFLPLTLGFKIPP